MIRLVPAYLFLLLIAPTLLTAQTTRQAFQDSFQVSIKRATGPIKVDGDLSESDWQAADVASDFWLKWPRDGEQAASKTEFRLTYDDKFLYLSATCYDTGAYIIQSLKRDNGYWDSDGVAIVLDPNNKTSNGYFFGTNALGVQTEGLIVPFADNDDSGGDYTWDNRWYLEVKHYPDRWTAEFAIPFQIIRFDEGQNVWGINFIRNDLSTGTWHTWSKVPFQFDGTDLGWTGSLHWDAPPRRSKGNYNLSPYATGSVSRDYEEGEDWKGKPGIGLDAKVGIGSALNLDLTFNPDFSQVEIDEQVINLTRFNVQLPEKRTFFLENGDIFGNFGIPPIRPFFSRRIGLDESGSPVPILFGARLTGNVGSGTRIGALNMQTRASDDGTPSQNFSALSFQQNIIGRSNIRGYFLNRQAFDGTERIGENFNRNAGFDANYISNNGKWNAWVTHHQSFQPTNNNKSAYSSTGFMYANRKFDFIADIANVGVNFETNMGFEFRIKNYDVKLDTTIRLGYKYIFFNHNHRFFPKKENTKLNFRRLSHESFSVFNTDGSLNEQTNGLNYEWQFRNTSEFGIAANYAWANVPVNFKFDDEEDLTLCPALPPGIYQFVSGEIGYDSDFRKKIGYSVEAAYGQFYNGTQTALRAEARLRAQPWGSFRLGFEYNILDFPEPYCDVELINITPRIEIFINRKLNWTTFLQFNNQADNFNINSRIQWRYRPMSDVFLVYTDNYTATTGQVKNKALVLKVNYWL